MNRRDFLKLSAITGSLMNLKVPYLHFHDNVDEKSNLSLSELQTREEKISLQMVEGIDRYLDRKTESLKKSREEYWNVDFSSSNAYEESVHSNRKRLAQIIGAVDKTPDEVDLEFIESVARSSRLIENDFFTAYAVRWPVYDGVYGEGILLQPKNRVRSRVVAIPDADQTPEKLVGIEPGISDDRQYVRHLAGNGCQVIIPAIIDRSDEYSGSERLDLYTNQPHREWIYRQAYTFGRHIIGYEVQKILSAVGWFVRKTKNGSEQIGVVGWGEGALLGLYAAALDTRIDTALISGYFDKREDLWQEPIYRNLFGFLREFGDAELTRLIIPRNLIIEYSEFPQVSGPPPERNSKGRSGSSAAPGKIITPAIKNVEEEVERAKSIAGRFESSIQFIHNDRDVLEQIGRTSLLSFLQKLQPETNFISPGPDIHQDSFKSQADFSARKQRQVVELECYTQRMIDSSRHVREYFFWDKLEYTTPDDWEMQTEEYRAYFWENIIGKISDPKVDMNSQTRQIYDEATWTGYDITINVLPDIFAWGFLLKPKNIVPGEKRPVIVVQHGGSGLPSSLLDKDNPAYKGLAIQLVERGFIVFSMHFPWRAGDKYRNLQRKANPLGLSIFSFILIQHERVLDWLSLQPEVDTEKIGLYGLSWGGKVAVRVPALIKRYSISVCAGDFNEWIWKNATTDWHNSYMFVPEYEMFDFNLGKTFNYGEMAALIAPRAFMVERGHDDGVGIDEWVAFEYAKVNRLYSKLGIPEQTEIEFFNGGHVMNAKRAIEFIHKHFNWPLPS